MRTGPLDATLAYDVVTHEEARDLAKGRAVADRPMR